MLSCRTVYLVMILVIVFREAATETLVTGGAINKLTLSASLVKSDIAVKLALAFPNNIIEQTITHDIFGRTTHRILAFTMPTI